MAGPIEHGLPLLVHSATSRPLSLVRRTGPSGSFTMSWPKSTASSCL